MFSLKKHLQCAINIQLRQNYPTPSIDNDHSFFQSPTICHFSGGWNRVILLSKVYDITGREIETLVNEELNPGTYEVTFDGSNYRIRSLFLSVEKWRLCMKLKKLILLK